MELIGVYVIAYDVGGFGETKASRSPDPHLSPPHTAPKNLAIIPCVVDE